MFSFSGRVRVDTKSPTEKWEMMEVNAKIILATKCSEKSNARCWLALSTKNGKQSFLTLLRPHATYPIVLKTEKKTAKGTLPASETAD
jgi:hypothetical protein